MLASLLLVPGLLLGQTPPAVATPSTAKPPAVTTLPASTALPKLEFTSEDGKASEPKDPAVVVDTETKDESSVFSRPFFADRSYLSFVTSTGPGRFNMIDWESRPNVDRLWWLSRWPADETVQLHFSLGFNIHWWAGPVADGPRRAPDLPPRVYDLYLDAIWAQHWTDRITSEVRFRPGLYTDFRVTPPDGFRAPGEAVALFRVCDCVHLVGGVANIQRNDFKVLPIGGILWQPTPAWELRLVFPEPKIAFQLSPQHHVWGYLGGEYGGGRWTYDNAAGKAERVEYSDFRLVFGIEWREDYLSNLKLLSAKSASFIEMGYVWERQLRFSSTGSSFDPTPAWMIRFGRAW